MLATGITNSLKLCVPETNLALAYEVVQFASCFLFPFLTGIISTTGSLDRESKDRYVLDVYAQVKGAPPSTSSPFQVVVMVSDENDNSPSFEKREYKVSHQS